MHMHPTPLAIALAIILSTSSHVIAAPHRRHHSLIDRGHHGLDPLEQDDQRFDHGPMHTATPPAFHPPSSLSSVAVVTVPTVKTVTVFPTPVKAPSATFALPSVLAGLPIPAGTKRPVTLSPSTTTSTSSKTTTTKTTTSKATSSANKAASSAATTFSSSIVVALPSSSLTITITVPTSVAIPTTIDVPSVTVPSIADISSSAVAEALSALSASLATATATATTSDSDSDAEESTTATTTTTSSTETSTTASTTCSSGTTRKCCSAVHDLTKSNLFDTIDEVIPGFSLNFLGLDTSIGLDCVDIDEEDDTNTDGDVCWDVVSCCDNASLGSIFLGCEPIIF